MSCFVAQYCKNVASVVDLYIDWADVLADGETVLSSQWSYDDESGLRIVETDEPENLDRSFAKVRIADGINNSVGRVANTVTLSDGQQLTRVIRVVIFRHEGLVEYDYVGSRAVLSATHTLTTVGSIADYYSATLTGEHTLTTSATVISNASADSTVSHTLTTGGRFVPLADAALGGVYSLVTGGHLSSASTAAMTGGHSLTTGAGLIFDPNASASLTVDYALATGGRIITHGQTAGLSMHTLATGGTVLNPTPPPTPGSWMGIGYDAAQRTLFDTTGYTTTTVTNQAEFAAAIGQMRSGNVDRIWLTPGTFYEWPHDRALSPFDREGYGYNSRTHPAIIETLPTALPTRAVIQSKVKFENAYSGAGPLNGIAFLNLEFAGASFFFDNPGMKDILIEGCYIHQMPVTDSEGIPADGMLQIQPVHTADPASNASCRGMIYMRFNFVGPSWRNSGIHIQNVYLFDANIQAEFNTYWRGGWSDLHTRQSFESDGGPDIFKHAIYADKSPHAPDIIGKSIFRYNVFAEPSSHAVHYRHGGQFDHNLILKAPITQIGYAYNASYGLFHTSGTCKGNVWIESDDISIPPAANLKRGIGLQLENVRDLTVEDNIWAFNQTDATNNVVLKLRSANGQGFDPSVVIRNNISHQWGVPFESDPAGGGFDAQCTIYGNHFEDGNVTYADPNSLLTNYAAAVTIPYIKSQDYMFTPAWIGTALADCRNGMTIV